MNKTTKYIIIGAVSIFFLFFVFWGMYSIIDSYNKKLNLCAEEYGFEKRTNWEGGWLLLNYSYKYVSERTFACCLRGRYLYNGELRDENCTSLHNVGEEK